MSIRALIFGLLVCLFVCPDVGSAQLTSSSEPEKVEIRNQDGIVNVLIEGQLFTSFDSERHRKPIFYPVFAPGQIGMTRDWPMKDDVAGQSHDHPWHKSIWFSHEISGIDFWSEKGGTVTTTQIEIAQDSDFFSTQSDWIKKSNGKTILRDRTQYWFGGDQQSRWIDCCINFQATHGDIEFEDTKEGLFAVRTHPDLRLTANPSAGVHSVFGSSINSNGVTGKKVWGKRAKWMLYFGSIDEQPVSIALYDHPTNLRHPTMWHARDYGLIAANPFGEHFFLKKKKYAGAFKVKSGDSLKLRYRVEFFNRVVTSEMVEAKFKLFSQQPSPAGVQR